MVNLGFTHQIMKILSGDVNRFAFSQLLDILVKYELSDQVVVSSILSNLRIDFDPSEWMARLRQFLNQKCIFKDTFRRWDTDLKMRIEDFVSVLDAMKDLDHETISAITAKDPAAWMQEAELAKSIKDSGRPMIMQKNAGFAELVEKEGLFTWNRIMESESEELAISCNGFATNAF